MCTHYPRRNQTRIPRRSFLASLPATALLTAVSAGPARASAPTLDLPKPGPRDVCPVCGMFVAKYPEWVATVLWSDGEAAHFDGPKDFFKYLERLDKYAPGRAPDQIAGMGVTEYYGLALIDAKAARYVIGSDVYGPMGHELVPLETAVDATDFLRDHKGTRELGFDDIAFDMLVKLDNGVFE